MSIFTTFGQKKIREMDSTKSLTAGKRVIDFEPKEVFIPIVDPISSKPIALNAKVGDEVKKGDIILANGKPKCVIDVNDKTLTVINYEI